MKKQLLLTLISTTLLVVFFLLPQNREWLQERIIPYWKAIPQQSRHLDYEYRKIKRHESSYVYSVLIAKAAARKKLSPETLILVPGPGYFKKQGLEYEVPEPAVFYYFTGRKTVQPSHKGSREATWFVAARNGQVILDSFASAQACLDTIQRFKMMDP